MNTMHTMHTADTVQPGVSGAPQTPPQTPPETLPENLKARFRRAKEARAPWESHWRECYDYALPQRGPGLGLSGAGQKRTEKLFDGTAPDGVDQLAASLLSQLTPPWSRWFGLRMGARATAEERSVIAPELEDAAELIQSHFDKSNFAVEAHQCYLDLVTAGTACLLFEEAPAGAPSAFRFQAVPLPQAAFEEGGEGRLETTYRRAEYTAPEFRRRFPKSALPAAFENGQGHGQGNGPGNGQGHTGAAPGPERKIAVIEAVEPAGPGASGFRYTAVLDTETGGETGGAAGTATGGGRGGGAQVLAQGQYRTNPFINFRWLKAPGEIYGRSPVMKALPDIKTANKVVELVLKNASIAVTGIWQADDDGVLNPATVKLTPGAIIPKAVGSKGLTPLEAPGRFDLSQLMLSDLRTRIRHALLADVLGAGGESPKMTATEVLERSSQMARILGATYGRMQSELLTPLVMRAVSILARRGLLPDLPADGTLIDLHYTAPLARNQARQEARNTLMWLDSIKDLGPGALASVNAVKTARWLARAYGVPEELVNEDGAAALQAGAEAQAGAESQTGAGDAGDVEDGADGGGLDPALGAADMMTEDGHDLR